MEAIEVTVHIDKDGRANPLRFTWQGQAYLIDNTGRRWNDPDGEHILVMTASGRMFELLYQRADGRWYLANSSPSGMRA